MARPREVTSPSKVPSSSQKGLLAILLEIVLFLILLLPNIFRAFFRKLWPPKFKSLDGLVVLVTGAGKGLGRELALGFARHGCQVACVDIDKEAALDTAEEIVRDGEKARAYYTDVTNPEEVSDLRTAVVKDLGPVDILVNSVSVFYRQRVEDNSESAVKAVTSINFLSHIWMTKEFLPSMKERGSGHIVAVSSLAAHSALASAALYVGTRWAVNGFMESLRLEVLWEGYNNIHFTTVCPALADTNEIGLTKIQRLVARQPDQVAASTVTAVRRNQTYVNTPEQVYYLCAIAKLLPTPVVDWALELLIMTPNSFEEGVKDTIKNTEK